MKHSIIARGIKVHNLKNVNLNIPLRRFIVITGVSGSGKSSLAFDTLYAEGQRRYVESFSSYARQFLERMDKPDVDHIEGLPPAIAIEQKNLVKNRRSTVGTATEINDYLRLLFAKIGKTYCERCKNPVESNSITDVQKKVMGLKEGTKIIVVFPIIDSKEINSEGVISRLREQGIVRILADGNIIDISQFTDIVPTAMGYEANKDSSKVPEPAIHNLFNIERFESLYGVIDRLTVKDGIEDRLTDAIETAYRLSGGYVGIASSGNEPANMTNNHSISGSEHAVPDSQLETFYRKPLTETSSTWKVKWNFSSRFVCNLCNIEYPEPVPQHFSFNNPIGACPVCQGFGQTIEIDMDLVIPDKKRSIAEGAIAPWNSPKYSHYLKALVKNAARYNISIDMPFQRLNKTQIRLIMEGTDDFYGINEFFNKLEQKKYKMHIRVFLSKYRGYTLCPSCSGTRLNSQTLNVKIKDLNIADICSMNIEAAYGFFKDLKLDNYEQDVADLILNEIRERLGYMLQVGLGYLTLDRLTRTLSGGEAQRVNLTTSLGSSLVNTLYILDEPSIGLHTRDTARLIWTLKKLRDIGNTVVVVEHDREIIKASDEIIDIGPGAGENGGHIMYQGPIGDLIAKSPLQNSDEKFQKTVSKSLTIQYLSGKKDIKVPDKRRIASHRSITLKGAAQNNLKDIDVTFPLDLFVCVTGVSGSGKSTLIEDTLYGALKKKIDRYNGAIGKHDCITGHEYISDVILVDQSPIGLTPRSNPITYIKVFDEIRNIFANTREARLRNKGPGHFSFNVSGGRCDNCEGGGQEKIEMQFLADIYVTCEYCQGKRFRKEILEIRYKHRNIYEVLEMTVDDAAEFFKESSRISRGLKYLQDTGLGYLRLGQPATTLSGGEAQRLKLATYMARGATERILFIFDEPTTGLHFYDIQKLLNCFNKLIESGHSIIVIEHNMEVIKCADYLIDLGPESGDNGGWVVGCGTPEEIASLNNSYTGRYLRPYLAKD